MKKITCIKLFTFLITCLCVVSFGFGQTKLAELTFESPGGYTTDITEFTDGGRDYFLRTNGLDISGGVNFNMPQGSYFFTAMDINGEGATLPVKLNFNNINISGYSNIEFRVHLAEDDQNTSNGNTQHWDSSANGNNNDYVHFNYDIDDSGTFSELLWIEATGIGVFNVEPSIDTDYDGIGDGTAITDTFTEFTQSIVGPGSSLDIEVVFNLNGGNEDIAIDNIEIWGTLVACGATVIWDGTAWSNGTGPDITTEATLNGDYTTLGSIGSFSACSLTLNNADLLIADNTFVEVQNDITVNTGSSIDVQPYGAVVQNNDFGFLTNNGTMTVDKITAPMNAWYEYTYWSSPVLGETLSGAIISSEPSRRYLFNGQNFLDATAETGNNNAAVAGQDDIDDNGDDWQSVAGATAMQAGIGYATTLTEFAYNTAPGVSNKPFRFTFEGDFNNGVITVPVYRNDSELNDYNWNLIGNPYPSAIDADLFLAANSNIAIDVSGSGYIDGAIFLWSQNTAPSGAANGNQALNFSSDDYAIINAVGENAGGDGVSPTNRKIPSGQAFFVSMSNAAPATLVSGSVYTTNVTFNNAMRVNGATDNGLFFKNSNVKGKSNTTVANKLWLNLTSDNGVFNQILVGYVNGATNNDDGISFDTNKYPVNGSALYTIIEGSNKKFAIQGKAPSDLNGDEVISLGFKTSIDVATLYTLSIAQLQGDFLNGNTIYLKDNLLNKTHNLSASNYTFTSEIGEFNSRFEIGFNAEALSSDVFDLNEDKLSIVELKNDNVQFSVSSNLRIKSVTIFDMLGRQLYDLKGQSNSETYKLSNLNNSMFIAKVALFNGAVITKKAIKK